MITVRGGAPHGLYWIGGFIAAALLYFAVAEFVDRLAVSELSRRADSHIGFAPAFAFRATADNTSYLTQNGPTHTTGGGPYTGGP
jgi:hypothetical protein